MKYRKILNERVWSVLVICILILLFIPILIQSVSSDSNNIVPPPEPKLPTISTDQSIAAPEFSALSLVVASLLCIVVIFVAKKSYKI